MAHSQDYPGTIMGLSWDYHIDDKALNSGTILGLSWDYPRTMIKNEENCENAYFGGKNQEKKEIEKHLLIAKKQHY